MWQPPNSRFCSGSSRCCQRRTRLVRRQPVLDEVQRAARLQHPVHLGQRRRRVRDGAQASSWTARCRRHCPKRTVADRPDRTVAPGRWSPAAAARPAARPGRRVPPRPPRAPRPGSAARCRRSRTRSPPPRRSARRRPAPAAVRWSARRASGRRSSGARGPRTSPCGQDASPHCAGGRPPAAARRRRRAQPVRGRVPGRLHRARAVPGRDRAGPGLPRPRRVDRRAGRRVRGRLGDRLG